MRKRLYQLYNILSSYPVLFLLIIGIAVMLHMAGQYKPIELAKVQKLDAKIQLKQKRNSMEKDLVDIEIVDLAKRYTLFNQDFLKLSDLEDGTLFQQIENTLESYGWRLERIEEVFVDDSNYQDGYSTQRGVVRINGVIVHIEANSLRRAQNVDEPFLPLFASTSAMKYMWARPPFKEYQKFKLSRLDDGFRFEASFFMPLQDKGSMYDLEEEKAI
ncbi:MAG: hypothetical protein VXZ83_02250 [Verrucomicrobiota bacterium]|nr:hypothetical protein [Verrucomicrobiota bacterium]